MALAPGFREEDVLTMAAALERGSEHPLAAAIVAAADAKGLQASPAVDFQSITGKGVSGVVDGRRIALGNAALLRDLGVDPGVAAQEAESMRAEARTVMYLAVDGQFAGLLGAADPIKDSTPEALKPWGAQTPPCTGVIPSSLRSGGRRSPAGRT